MTIQGGNIHNILRTYNKQIKYGKVAGLENDGKPADKNLDKVSLSPQAKKVMFMSNIMSDPVNSGKISPDELEAQLKDVNFSQVTDEELETLKNDILENL